MATQGDEVDPVEEEGAEPAPPKIERRLNEETCPAYAAGIGTPGERARCALTLRGRKERPPLPAKRL